MEPTVDHLVYGCPDLERGCDEAERLLGVRPAPGGRHPAFGTHNALVSLGRGVYLEIIAPDPDVPPPASPRPFGLDGVDGPRLIAWAARVSDIDAVATAARSRGYEPGQVFSASRDLPGGGTLQWKLAVNPGVAAGGVVPFLIEWVMKGHPSATSPQGCMLVDLEAEHPHPAGIQPMLSALGVDLQVSEAGRPALLATIECPRGTVVLS
jgi:hypothetical protein